MYRECFPDTRLSRTRRRGTNVYLVVELLPGVVILKGQCIGMVCLAVVGHESALSGCLSTATGPDGSPRRQCRCPHRLKPMLIPLLYHPIGLSAAFIRTTRVAPVVPVDLTLGHRANFAFVL